MRLLRCSEAARIINIAGKGRPVTELLFKQVFFHFEFRAYANDCDVSGQVQFLLYISGGTKRDFNPMSLVGVAD